jgi:hypothetical protein
VGAENPSCQRSGDESVLVDEVAQTSVRRSCSALTSPMRAGVVSEPAGGGIGGNAGDPDEAGVVVDEEQGVEPPEEHGVEAEESRDQAFRLAARNSARDRPDRRGRRSMPWRLTIAQTLHGAIRMPMVASSPWMCR